MLKPQAEPNRELTPEDFDGHTDFDKLTPEQRLQWLSDMLDFMETARQSRRELRDDLSTTDPSAGKKL
jgi:hypothetical protein